MDGATIEFAAIPAAVVMGLFTGLMLARVLVRRGTRVGVGVLVTALAAILGAVLVTAGTFVDQQAQFEQFRSSFVDARIDEGFEWSFFIATEYRIEAISPRTGQSLGAMYGSLKSEESPPLMWMMPAGAMVGYVWLVGGLTWFFARRRSKSTS